MAESREDTVENTMLSEIIHLGLGITYSGQRRKSGELEDLKEFLEKHKPSEIECIDGELEWLRCSVKYENITPDQPYSSDDVDALRKSWNKLQNRGDDLTWDTIQKLALKYNILDGNWYWFVSKEDVDRIWETVCHAIIRGEIRANSAEVGLERAKSKTCVVRIFTFHFTDTRDVMAVKDEIRKIGITKDLIYKPRILTYLGIYKNNIYGIRSGMFKDTL